MKRNYYNIHKIDADTWCIEEKRLNQQCLMYLLVGKERALLIDTGFGFGNLGMVVRQLTEKPVFVVNTHAHVDHIGGNHYFKEIYACEKDKEIFQIHTNKAYLEKMVNDSIPFLVRPLFGKIKSDIVNQKIAGEYYWFQPGWETDLGERKILSIAVPGHTPGSVCYLDAQRGRLFSGDTVCEWGVLLHLEGCCSIQTYLDSMKILKARSSEWDTIWPGHHGMPIRNHYIDEYLECAQKAVEGAAEMRKVKQYKEVCLGNVLITLPDEKSRYGK